jgi:hypothetical protein
MPIPLLWLVGAGVVGGGVLLASSSSSSSTPLPTTPNPYPNEPPGAATPQPPNPMTPNPAAFGSVAGYLPDGTPLYATPQTTGSTTGDPGSPIYQSADGRQWITSGSGYIQWFPLTGS